MRPAREGLDRFEAMILEIPFRLVMQEEFVAFDRPAQVAHQVQMRGVVIILIGRVDREPAAGSLGRVHGDVRPAHQGIWVVAVAGGEGDADAGADVASPTLQQEGTVQWGVGSNGTENWNKDRYAARSSTSLGSRSGRSWPCRIDSFRANSYRPSTLTWSSNSGESRWTSSGLTATSVARTLVKAASR